MSPSNPGSGNPASKEENVPILKEVDESVPVPNEVNEMEWSDLSDSERKEFGVTLENGKYQVAPLDIEKFPDMISKATSKMI